MQDNIIKVPAGQMIWETVSVCGDTTDIGMYALIAASNHLAARGALEMSASVQILIPKGSDKAILYQIKKDTKRTAKDIGIPVAGMEERMCRFITQPFITITAAGFVPAEPVHEVRICAGMDIVMTKWAGMEGMLRIAGEQREALSKRFTPSFLNQIESFRAELLAFTEAEAARQQHVPLIRQMSGGGVMAALWDLSVETGLGLAADIKKIPVRQETIEVCELYRLSPYEIPSAGCMLMLTTDGNGLIEVLRKKGIASAVIGKMMDNNDKILNNGDERRYIDRPKLGTGYF